MKSRLSRSRRLSRLWAFTGVAVFLLPQLSAAATSRVFVTSTKQDGDLGGLAGADALCEGLATTAGLGGKWVAWLSTSTVDAKDRLDPFAGPFVRAVDTTQIADDITDLTDGTLDAAIADDENDTFVGSFEEVWTATGGGGLKNLPSCVDWTSGLSTESGDFGTPDESDSRWTDLSAVLVSDCSEGFRLYCFEVEAPSAVPSMSLLGRIAMPLALLMVSLAPLRRIRKKSCK